jgi:hypothetical protein
LRFGANFGSDSSLSLCYISRFLQISYFCHRGG